MRYELLIHRIKGDLNMRPYGHAYTITANSFADAFDFAKKILVDSKVYFDDPSFEGKWEWAKKQNPIDQVTPEDRIVSLTEITE